MSCMDMIPTQDDYENALKRDMDLDKKIIKLGESNELACEELILSINTSFSVGREAFEPMRNVKSTVFWRETARLHATG